MKRSHDVVLKRCKELQLAMSEFQQLRNLNSNLASSYRLGVNKIALRSMNISDMSKSLTIQVKQQATMVRYALL